MVIIFSFLLRFISSKVIAGVKLHRHNLDFKKGGKEEEMRNVVF